ncbi:conserved hypothetical protein [Nostocoides japonicum T1-X7]|uniref:Uncharacterized protein n=1 Tax=Nostocoides japonicum T1-X7 TaxID=1194083 RepID=A0A077M225_9MICO|nr:hypothetical protein [Tetrasphaera japonica]CCH79107.1 conserved hypothetical protein [Tetrasphaera japonica T1-X7]
MCSHGEEGVLMRYTVPDGVPVLSVGRHRRPRKGACFMEFASYLAGEKWSDHPSCTHPLLAGLARTINDLVDDEHRSELVPLIPDVVGVTGDDLAIDVTIAARAAMAALPVVSMEYQRALAVGLVTTDRIAATLDHPSMPALREEIAAVLTLVPDAASWAGHFTEGTSIVEARIFRKLSAPRIVAYAGRGIALAIVMDPDDRLVALLRRCIEDARMLTGHVGRDDDRYAEERLGERFSARKSTVRDHASLDAPSS